MEDFIFADETEEISAPTYKPWKILISDDEKEIHTITKIVLSNFLYEDRGIEILDAYSRKETIAILEEHDDIAVLLLDVVMETDDAGLLAAKDIRETLKNKLIRIILRTGQPGSAPEKDVISKYDINDYKEKTELTTTKLYTTVMTALRSYRDLHTIENNKIGLEKILNSTSNIMKFKNVSSFSASVLHEYISILNLSQYKLLDNTKTKGIVVSIDNNDNYILEVKSKGFITIDNSTIIPDNVKLLFNRAVKNQESFYDGNKYIVFFKNDNDLIHLLYLESSIPLTEEEIGYLNIFSTNVDIVYNNISLTYEITSTQKEIIETLSEVVEKRSKETSKHVLRVAQVSKFLALKTGVSEDEADQIAMASPLHDIGKTGIPDSILLKPSKLTPEEYTIMKGHAKIGRDILGTSDRPLLKAASIIAYEHHEKWDGSGYPCSKKGDEIHLYGRITAIADVFDALYHKRCYKDAWSLEKIISLFKEERGKHFDPELTDIFLNNIDNILEIVKKISK